MSDWTTPADLRTQLARLWERDALLASTFPLRLTLRAPASAELSDRFDDARAWASALRAGTGDGYRLVWRDVRHRVIGQNSLPGEAWVDSLADALRLIGRTAHAERLVAQQASVRERIPALLPWLDRHPRRAVALAAEWPLLLDVVGWVVAHPRPGVYLRQVDLPGVDSKFIEAHRGVLGELLEHALPADAIDSEARGTAQFARRYGFRDKPQRVRLRFLDPRQPGWVAGGDADFTLGRQSFERLDVPLRRVFITENETNFLAFPAAPDSLVIFGAGYGFEALAQAAWLQRCPIHYWGDIDTHGFAILDQLRASFGHVRSFLMDRATLLEHSSHWLEEPQPTRRDLTRLDDDERLLYDDLRWQRLRDGAVRLEQERVSYGRVALAVASLCE